MPQQRSKGGKMELLLITIAFIIIILFSDAIVNDIFLTSLSEIFSFLLGIIV